MESGPLIPASGQIVREVQPGVTIEVTRQAGTVQLYELADAGIGAAGIHAP
jgi:hypothetical protein